jgi:hypothetical protein
MSNPMETARKVSLIRKNPRTRILLAAKPRLKERQSSWAMRAAEPETATRAAQRLDGGSSYALF